MNERRRQLQLRKLVAIQTTLVFVSGITWFYFRTAAYLAGPPDPDIYAWSWGFQAVVFVFFYIPALIAISGVLLFLEFFLFRLYDRARAAQIGS